MLILLPPSEGKSVVARGPRLSLSTLSFPELEPVRSRLVDRLMALCQKESSAMRVLGLGPTQAAEVARNRELLTAGCAPAIDVYTGVLYEALDPQALTAVQRGRLNRDVVIASALWGLVRPADLIPAYRLSGDTSLPRSGPVAGVWKDPITALLAQEQGVILDLRSGAYRFGGLPIRDDVAVGRVLLERDGRRSVVSHHNKATKGRIVRALVSSRRAHTSLADIATTLEASGITVEMHASAKGAITMDLVTTEL